jgi:ribosome-associated heat shock protein Hsp15
LLRRSKNEERRRKVKGEDDKVNYDGNAAENSSGPSRETQRLDKWLWFARIAKSRSLAQGLIVAGRVRINGVRATKSSATIKLRDALTIVHGGAVRVLRVLSLGERRGPYDEARGLYDDIKCDPRESEGADATGLSSNASVGKPDKRERRKLNRLRNR